MKHPIAFTALCILLTTASTGQSRVPKSAPEIVVGVSTEFGGFATGIETEGRQHAAIALNNISSKRVSLFFRSRFNSTRATFKAGLDYSLWKNGEDAFKRISFHVQPGLFFCLGPKTVLGCDLGFGFTRNISPFSVQSSGRIYERSNGFATGGIRLNQKVHENVFLTVGYSKRSDVSPLYLLPYSQGPTKAWRGYSSERNILLSVSYLIY